MPNLLSSSRERYREFLRKRTQELSKPVEKPKDAATPAPKRDWTQGPEPHGKRRASRSFWQLMRAFLPLLHDYRAGCAIAIFTVIISTLCMLLTPIGAKITLDYVIAPNAGHLEQLRQWGWLDRRVELGWWVGLASVGVACISLLVGTLGRYQMTRMSKLVQVAVRRKVFDHMSALPLHRISALKSGGVSSILRDDAGIVGEMLFSLLYNPLRAIITLVGGLCAMAVLDWRLVLGGLAFIPAVWLTHRTWIGRIRPVFSTIKQTRTSTDAQATEAFGGMRIVRAFDRRRGEATRFSKNNHLMARQEMLIWWWSRIIEGIWMIILPASTAIGLAYGGGQVIKGNLTVGDIGAFLTYLGMVLGPMELLVGTASQLQNGLAGWDRCLDILEEKREFADAPPGARPIERQAARGEIALRNVSFTYPNMQEPVLHEVTLHAAAGTTIALVGASGSGKTTLCNLVARFFDPTTGVIELDGADLRAIEVESYRRLLGIVEQDVFLFDGTVAENIAYANRDAPIEAIERAARIANAEEFIVGLEKKYETVIGERGVRLSGGQKQRIAIARAVLADPKILILDEATSSLDSESERLIQTALAELMKGRTSFVIAHRLSTIRNADQIVVLERGRVIETGTHDQLVERRGRYYDMLQVQLHTARDYAAG